MENGVQTSTGAAKSSFIASIRHKIVSFFSDPNGWVQYINSQLKTSVGILIKVFTGVLILFVFNLIGVCSVLRKVVVDDLLQIKLQSVEVVSSPNIDYKNDLLDLDATIALLERKGKESKEKEKKSDAKVKK